MASFPALLLFCLALLGIFIPSPTASATAAYTLLGLLSFGFGTTLLRLAWARAQDFELARAEQVQGKLPDLICGGN